MTCPNYTYYYFIVYDKFQTHYQSVSLWADKTTVAQ